MKLFDRPLRAKFVPPPGDCNSSGYIHHTQLGHWVEFRSKRRDPASLSAEMLQQIDTHTDVDAPEIAAAPCLIAGRLRTVVATGASLLGCIDWYA